MSARTERLSFSNPEGNQLAARLDLPAGEPRAFALFAHCFTCSKDLYGASRISRALAGRGLAVLRFDFTGLGHSEGEFANTGFSSNVGDLVAAADFLRARYRAPTVLIGHSWGGAAVLAAAERVPEATAVVTIAAPADPGHVRHALGMAAEAIERTGEAEVTLGGRRFRVRKEFLDDIAGQNLLAGVGRLRRALLVLHAPRDEVVGIENATAIYTAAKHPKSFVSLDDAEHLLTRPEDAAYVAEIVAAWVGRYLPPPAEAASETVPEPGVVRVAETGEGVFTQEVRLGRHTLRADEPENFGGLDTGPSPYDLLLAALGACTTMTLRMYARRKSLPLARAAVTLRHAKIHAEDCAECETREGKVDRIERAIELEGELDEAQRRRLLEIADRCPVHRTLTSEVVIRTRLGQQGQ